MDTTARFRRHGETPKKLRDLSPAFLTSGGDGVRQADGSPAPLHTGVGVCLDCPCGDGSEDHRLFVPFRNPLDGGAGIDERGWQRTGSTFDDLTLTPSIQRMSGCKWHGFITNGEVITV